jgi:hypothetical protein
MRWSGMVSPLHPSKLDVSLPASPPSYARFARRHPLTLCSILFNTVVTYRLIFVLNFDFLPIGMVLVE